MDRRGVETLGQLSPVGRRGLVNEIGDCASEPANDREEGPEVEDVLRLSGWARRDLNPRPPPCKD